MNFLFLYLKGNQENYSLYYCLQNIQPARGSNSKPAAYTPKPVIAYDEYNSDNAVNPSQVGAERLSSSGHGHAGSARIARSSAPYQAKHGRSVSPSVDDSPGRVAEKASPSHTGLDHGFTRVLGRHEQINDWQRNVLPDDLGRRFETSAGYRYNNGVNLDRPRALIDAYGIDEREKPNYKHLKGDHLKVNGIHKNVPVKTWQNTEEEEFNWEDMSPAIADSGRSSDLFPSSIPLPANFRSRPGPGTQPGAPLVTTNFRSKLSHHGHLTVFNYSYANEDISAISV